MTLPPVVAVADVVSEATVSSVVVDVVADVVVLPSPVVVVADVVVVVAGVSSPLGVSLPQAVRPVSRTAHTNIAIYFFISTPYSIEHNQTIYQL